MDTPFVYDKYVTGKNFIGRKSSCTVLGNLLSQGEHVVIWDAPKSGKTSLIQQTMWNLRITGKQFTVCEISLLNIRDAATFLTRLGTTVLRSVASTPDEYARLMQRHLAGTHFVFDQRVYSEKDQIVSLDWDIDDTDIMAMLRLPSRLAQDGMQPLFLILDEFQSLANCPQAEKIWKALEQVLSESRGSQGNTCTFLFVGSMVNAMKEIFVTGRYFYRQVTRFQLPPVEEKEIVEHVVKGFLSGGKVIDRNLLMGMCRLFKNHLWYINHFVAICDAKSKGYIVESTLMEALSAMISIHEPRFKSIVNNLTTFQLGLLKAILDGHMKFSSSEVIQKYALNSSANVKRLKDALMKKEIITFDEKEEPYLLDPLFEYWVRRYYFEMETTS